MSSMEEINLFHLLMHMGNRISHASWKPPQMMPKMGFFPESGESMKVKRHKPINK